MSSNINKLADGKHIFKVRAIDNFGNAGLVESREILIDSTGPKIGTLSINVFSPGEIPGLNPDTS